jgi:hypothetical protein
MRTAQQRNGENCESESFTNRHSFSSIQLEPTEEPRVASPAQNSALAGAFAPLKITPHPQSGETRKNHLLSMPYGIFRPILASFAK